MYILGFAQGAGLHLFWLLVNGIHVYGGYPLVSQVFLHSLIVLDSVAVYAVWRRRPWAPAVGCGVVLCDLMANWQGNWHAVRADPSMLLRPYGLPALTVFGLFVFMTALRLRASFAD
jgi:hypothetical protein